MPDGYPRTRALLITAGRYQDTRLPRLAGPPYDSIDLADALEAYGKAEVTTLAEQTTDQVEEQLERFLKSFDDSETAIVYFSGHGVRVGDRLFLATRSTDLDLLETTAIEAAWLRQLLNDCDARAKVWILDCCHAGADACGPSLFKGLAEMPALTTDLPKMKGVAAVGGPVVGGMVQGRGLAVLTAASADQQALDGLEGSPYTQALVRGLATGAADSDRDGWVSAEELAHHVHDVLEGDPLYQKYDIETRHFVDDVAGRIRLTRVPKTPKVLDRPIAPTQPGQEQAEVAEKTVQLTPATRRRDLGGAAVLLVVWLVVGGGILATKHNPGGAVLAGFAVGVLAYLGYTVTRRVTKQP